MKVILSIILLITLSFECFSNIYVWAGYEINKSYISRVLCVNRDDPSMHCDGKCFLKKQLQQNEQRKDNDSGALGTHMDVLLFCSEKKPLFTFDLYSTEFIFPGMNIRYFSPQFSRYFHPPKA